MAIGLVDAPSVFDDVSAWRGYLGYLRAELDRNEDPSIARQLQAAILSASKMVEQLEHEKEDGSTAGSSWIQR